MAITEQQRQDQIYAAIQERSSRSGVYKSPFEAFYQQFPRSRWSDPVELEPNGFVLYSGTPAFFFSEIERTLTEGESDIALAVYAPGIIRAVIDWKVDNPSESSAGLVADALSAGLAVYSRSPEVTKHLEDLRKRIEQEQPELINRDVLHSFDYPTWISTEPAKSYKTALKLAYDISGQDILLIALGHGGTAAGMDVFLRYQDISGSRGSEFYVVRFSRHKLNDERPQMSSEESRELFKIAQGKRVVIFEEDTVSGNTSQQANDFLRGVLFRDYDRSPIVRISNYMAGGFTPKQNVPNLGNLNNPIIVSDKVNLKNY